MVALVVHIYSAFNGLKQGLFINTCNEEAGFVQSLGTLGRGTDADGGERMAHTGEEGTFLGQSAAVGHYSVGIHLQAVIVMESEGLVLYDTWV